MSPVGSATSDPGATTEPRVEHELVCAECDYNLIGLPQAGRCPECGYSIDESIRAGGFWTQTRIRSLRWTCWLAALSVPPWTIAVGISRVSGPTPLLRGIVATLAVLHVMGILAAAYLGMGASSRLTLRSRRLLLVGITLAVVAVMSTPLLVVADWITRSSTSMGGVLVAANVERLLLIVLGGWWIMIGTKSLRPMWSSTLLLQRVALAVAIAGWCPLAIELLQGAAQTPVVNMLLQRLGVVAIATEFAATGLFAALAIALAVSLRRTPRRVSFASEP